MNQPRSTTMELPVKLVRAIAIRAFEFQRSKLKEQVMKEAEKVNARILKDNSSFLARYGFIKTKSLLDPAQAYEDWKQLYLADKLHWEHVAYHYFDRSSAGWWKRMYQFAKLPAADDGKTIWMSMEDLSLIDYAEYLQEVTEKLNAKEQA
jgi:hypothetical protein